MKQRLLIATRNQGKLLEYRRILQDLPLALIDLDEAGAAEEVDETGDTFAANARLKAERYAGIDRTVVVGR